MKCNPNIVNRIKRANGQMQGVLNMMESERSCDDIVTQLTAIRSTLDKTIALITTQNLVNTIEDNYNIEITDIDDALNLVVRSK